MHQNILFEYVEPYHLVIKVVVNWTAQVFLNLNCFQTQPRALNLSYAGTPDGIPSRAALSSSWAFWASVKASPRIFAWVTRSTEGRFGPPRVISSLRLSRVESSTSRKGFPAYSSPLLSDPAPAWSSKLSSSGLHQLWRVRQLVLQAAVQAPASAAGHGDDDFRRVEVLL